MNYKLKTRQPKPPTHTLVSSKGVQDEGKGQEQEQEYTFSRKLSSCDSRQRFRQRPTPEQMPATDSNSWGVGLRFKKPECHLPVGGGRKNQDQEEPKPFARLAKNAINQFVLVLWNLYLRRTTSQPTAMEKNQRGGGGGRKPESPSAV